MSRRAWVGGGVFFAWAVGQAAAAAQGLGDGTGFMLVSPAQLYSLDAQRAGAELAYDGLQHATTTSLGLARKATPSLYGALLAAHGTGTDETLLGTDGAFKILDQWVLGLGLRLRQDQTFSEPGQPAAKLTMGLVKVAALVKTDDYEAGFAFSQGSVRLPQQTRYLHAALLHGRWRFSPLFALGLQARQAPFDVGEGEVSPDAQLSSQAVWSYALTLESQLGAWAGQALYSHDEPSGQSGARTSHQRGALLLSYAVASDWALHLRLETAFSPVVQSTLYTEWNGAGAGQTIGLSGTHRW